MSWCPQRLEAYQRRASLLRGQLNRPAEADRLIEEMVSSDPNNPQVYLERARYRRGFAKTADDVKAVNSDLQRVLKQSGNEPDVYLELARVAEATGNIREALRILETGLKAVPEAPSLHEALAMLERRFGSIDKAIARLRQSVQLLPNEASLRLTLADLLAERGDVVELRSQIDELRKLNYSATSHRIPRSQSARQFKRLAEGPSGARQAPDPLRCRVALPEVSAQRPPGQVLCPPG